MKFLQTLTGDFINVDEIVCIEHEFSQNFRNDRYFSYLVLKDGSKKDFLELPDEFETVDGKYRLFSEDFILLWHRLALEFILTSYDRIILIDEVMDRTWEILMNEIVRKEKER